MKRKIILSGVLIGLFVFLPALAFAQDYYVSPTGSDNNPGTQSAPWRTIQKAAAIAVAGDTVNIADGTYTGTVEVRNSGTAGAPINFIGTGQNVIVTEPTDAERGFKIYGKSYIYVSNIRHSGAIFYVYNSSYITADRIKATNNHGISARGSSPGMTHHITFQNCEVIGNYLPHGGGALPNTGIGFGGGVSSSTIKGNIVRGCDNGMQVVADGNLISDIIIEDNIYYDNPNHGLYIGRGVSNVIVRRNIAWQNQEGLYLSGVDTAEVSNNVYYYIGPGIHYDNVLNFPNRQIKLRNNIMVNCNYFYGIDAESIPGGFSSDYNIFYRPSPAVCSWDPIPTDHWFQYNNQIYNSFNAFLATGQESHSLVVEPLFVNEAERDFHLQADSPAIDAGDPSYPAPEGGGARIDIGAFEYIWQEPTPIPPVADFTADVWQGEFPLTARFTDLSTDSDGIISEWAWDFDNNGTVESSLRDPTFVFTDNGTYNVKLTVTDNSGLSDDVIKQIIVTTPIALPSGRLSIVGDPNFNADNLSPEMRDWHVRLNASIDLSASYINDRASRGDLFYLGRTLNDYTTALLYGLRATGDLRFLDRAAELWELARADLKDAWLDGTTDGYVNWLWLIDPNNSTFYGKDTHSMDEAMTHGAVAMMAYALDKNRQFNPSYAEKADFWKNYLENQFLPKWYARAGGNQVTAWTTEGTGFYKRLRHAVANESRIANYLYLLTNNSFYLERSNWLMQKLALLLEINPSLPTAYQWKHQVEGSEQGYQPINYAQYFANVIQDYYHEGIGSYAQDQEMQKFMSTFRDVVFNKEASPWNNMAEKVDGTGLIPTTVYSLSAFGRWDATHSILDFADARYNLLSASDPMRVGIASGALLALAERETPILNQAPVLLPIGNKQVNEGEILEFTITASDPDGDRLSFPTPATLPPGASFTDNGNNTATFIWTPDYDQAGSYPVRFEVSDAALSDSEDITITVYNVNRDPSFFNPLTNSYVMNEGEVLDFSANARDPDIEDAVTITLKSTLSWLSVTGGTNPGNPADMQLRASPGYDVSSGEPVVKSIILRATDSYGAFVDLIITIRVNNVFPAPVISNVRARALATVVSISWNTDIASSSQVEYGRDGLNGVTPIDNNLVTRHRVVIRNLIPNSTYQFRVKSKNSAGIEAVSGIYSFRTRGSIVSTGQ